MKTRGMPALLEGSGNNFVRHEMDLLHLFIDATRPGWVSSFFDFAERQRPVR